MESVKQPSDLSGIEQSLPRASFEENAKSSLHHHCRNYYIGLWWVFFLISVNSMSTRGINAAWTAITFVDDSVHEIPDPDNENGTIVEAIPRLLIKSWYPFNAMSGMMYYIALVWSSFMVFFRLTLTILFKGIPNLLRVLLNVPFQFAGQFVLFLVDFCLRTVATFKGNSETFDGKLVECFQVAVKP